MNKDHRVLVVGAGMVGLMATALLLKQGFRVTLIDRNAEPNPDAPSNGTPSISARVSAIHRGSFRLFQKLHLEAEFTQYARAYTDMKIWDRAPKNPMDQDTSSCVHLNASQLFEPWLGWIIENHVLCQMLWRYCQGYLKSGQLDAHFEFQASQFSYQGASSEDQSKHWEVSDGSFKLQGQFLIGADGGQSSLREHQGIAITQHDYHQSALVTVLQLKTSHQNTAWQRFLPTGPLALLPLKDPHQGAIVWSSTHEHARLLQSLPESEFLALYQQQFQNTGIENALGLMTERKTFPLIAQHAKTYPFEGGVLVGDAAHKIHPLAGQGVNLGFMDVAALVALMARAHSKNRSPFGAQVSAQYACERALYNQITEKSMTLINQLYSNQSSLLSHLRSHLIHPLSRQRLSQMLLLEPALSRLPSLCEDFL